MSELFDISSFSSKNNTARDFELENISSKKVVKRCGVPQPYGTRPPSDTAWDDGSAFPSSKNWKVGDRVTTSHPLQKGKVYTIGTYPSIDATGKALYDWIETTCNLLLKCDSLTYVQESVPDSVTPACNSDSTSLELQKPMITAQISSQNDIREYTTTETCDRLPLKEDLDLCVAEKSTLLQPLPPVNHSASRESETVQTTNAIVSPPCCESSTITNQSLPQSKTPPGCSIVPIIPEIHACTVTTLQSNSQNPDTLSKGLSFQVFTLAPPLIEKDYCLLPTPTALSTMSSRPPGQTKLENFLKENSLIKRNEVLDPAILCQWYQIPGTWLDPSESRAATELLESNGQQQEIYSIPELQRSHSTESSTSIQLQNDLTPVIFLEENQQQQEAVKKPKRRQRQGCLYKYIENKTLKCGKIASYPRVIGHRDPDNPTHWRWGFNWEEKIDGEWKGRSIGSIPKGAIALIQSMQKSGVPIEEIIGFIRRAKAKPQKT